MSVEVAAVRTALRARGWARLSLDDEGFERLCEGLGRTVQTTAVRLVSGKRTYLTNPAAIPLHTDHPVARFIAWRCIAQDYRDGATLLVDGGAVAASLPKRTADLLERAVLPAMVRLGAQAVRTRVLRWTDEGPAVFFAPWLEPIDATDEVREALGAFARAVEREPSEEVRLEPGEVLVVDNRRLLHGRRALEPESPRWLERRWIDSL
jgi:hypothetical protein